MTNGVLRIRDDGVCDGDGDVTVTVNCDCKYCGVKCAHMKILSGQTRTLGCLLLCCSDSASMVSLGEQGVIGGALRELGLSGCVVEVHASLRSFAPRVAAGTILDAFVAEGCTVLLPAFTHAFEVRPTKGEQMRRNGFVYGDEQSCDEVVPYVDGEHVLVDDELGVLSWVAVNAGGIRGGNALNGFVSLGAHAKELVSVQTNEDTYAPVEMVASREGKLVLLGVGLTSATALHAAERRAGRKGFVRWCCVEGKKRLVRTGGCSFAFNDFTHHLPSPQTLCVGGSVWSVWDMREFLDAATKAVVDDPLLGLCDRLSCRKCVAERNRLL